MKRSRLLPRKLVRAAPALVAAFVLLAAAPLAALAQQEEQPQSGQQARQQGQQRGAPVGHCFGPNEQRGVFRSKDGGKTWEKVLYRTAQAGADDLILDPSNPNVIYASFWQFVRKPWTFESGGPDSAFFKSTDGGDT